MSGAQRARVRLRRALENTQRLRTALARAERKLDNEVLCAMNHEELRQEVADMIAARLSKGLDDE